jgi:hypothetical protein
MFKSLSLARVATVAAAALVPSLVLANAAAVTAVEAAEADGLLVAGALTAMAIGVWAALYIKRKFFGS